MKHLIPFLLFSIFAVSCIEKPEATDKIQFDQDKYLNAWVDMWNSYDLNQVDKLFLQDNRITYFSSEREGAFIGSEAVREHH